MKILCLFPHQDDEIGIAPMLKKEQALGHSIYCIYLTDGAGKGCDSQVRNEESFKALRELQIPPENVWYLGTDQQVPDGGLVGRLTPLSEALERRFGSLGIQKIYCTAYEGGHQDHDAAAVLAVQLAARWSIPGELWEFSLYHGYRVLRPFFRVLDLMDANGEKMVIRFSILDGFRFSFLCRFYLSQWKTWLGLYPQLLWRFVGRRSIRIQKVSASRVQTRPHSGPLLYERMGRMTYEAFTTHLASFIQCGSIK